MWPISKQMARAWSALTVFVVATCASQATPPADSTVIERWVRDEWQRAESEPSLGACRLECGYEQHWFPLPKEFAELEARVKDHPDHSERPLLTIYEQRRRGVPSTFRRAIWMNSDGWRLNEDFLSPEFPAGSFRDTAATRSAAFFLEPGSLSILDPRDAAPLGKDPQASRGTAIRTAQLLLTGGVWLATIFRAEPQGVSVSGREWTLQAVVPDGLPQSGLRWEIKGEWSEEHGRGFVTQLRVVTASPGQRVQSARAHDWVRDDCLDRWVARRVEVFDASDRLFERVTFQSADRVSPERMSSLFGVPRGSNGKYVDAVRGAVDVTAVHDHRPRNSGVRSPDGSMLLVPLPGGGTTGTAGPSAVGSWAGWVSAGGLFALLILLKVRWRPCVS